MPKKVHRMTSITTYRERTPTNPEAAYKQPNMVFDHSQNMRVIPDLNRSILVEATNRGASRPTQNAMTMNANGRSAAFDPRLSVGGGPDHAGRVYESGHVSKRTRGRSETSGPEWGGMKGKY